MWELDYKESWVLKNWCFWTVVFENTVQSPLDSKEIQSVHPKGDQSWLFTGKTDIEAETPILLPPDEKSWRIGKDSDAGRDWGQEEKGTTEDEMAGWHYWLNGHESLACCSPWGRKEADMTELLNWTDESNIPGFYAILFFTSLDFTFITKHIHQWAPFPPWPSPFIL